MARTGFPSRWRVALLDPAAAQSLGSPVPSWAMAPPRDAPVPQGCSSPADAGSQLLLQPSDGAWLPARCHCPPIPWPPPAVLGEQLRQGGCGLCGDAGCSSLGRVPKCPCTPGQCGRAPNVPKARGRAHRHPQVPGQGGRVPKMSL